MNERIVVEGPGGADRLKLVREPEPEPRVGEAKVRILACGVAYGDIMLRRGAIERASAYPLTPGYDFVGVVEAQGPGGSKYRVGDTVAGFPGRNAYQRWMCLPEEDLFPVPEGLVPEEAVSVVLNYVTAYQMLKRSAGLREGDTALIHGAAGGVGTAALQLGRIMGVKTIGTASAAKSEVVRRFGGLPIDHKDEDFVRETRRLEPDGVRAVFDPIGGNHLRRSYRTLANGGTLVAFGASSALQEGGNMKLKLASSMLTILSLKLRPGRRVSLYQILGAKKRHPEWFASDLATLFGYLEEGRIEPLVAEVLPLAQAHEAHERLESSSLIGKIVLRP